MLSPSIQQDLTHRVFNALDRNEPKFREDSLARNIHLISAETSRDYPIASVAIHFDAGSRREQKGEGGKMHFFEHLPPASYRLTSGGEDLLTLCRERSWGLEIYAGEENLSFAFQCPSFDVTDALKTLSMLFTNKEEVYRNIFPIERGRILDELEQARVDRGRVASNVFKSLFLSRTGLAHPAIGEINQVKMYTVEDVMLKGIPYLTNNNATFAVSGNAEAINKMRDFCATTLLFPEIGRVGENPSLRPAYGYHEVAKKTVIASPLFPGVELYMYLPGIKQENTAERLALRILIRDLEIKLVRQLSVERGFTYETAAKLISYTEVGFAEIKLSFSPENTKSVLDIISNIVDSFPSTVTQDLIEKQFIATRNRVFQELPHLLRSDALAAYAINPAIGYSTPAALLRLQSTLTREYLSAVAKKFISVENLRYVFFGSEDALAASQISHITL